MCGNDARVRFHRASLPCVITELNLSLALLWLQDLRQRSQDGTERQLDELAIDIQGERIRTSASSAEVFRQLFASSHSVYP